MPSKETGDERLAFSIQVVERYGRLPLAGFELSLRQGDRRWRGVTDAAGNLITPQIWEPGVVSLVHRTSEARPEYESTWDLRPWQVELLGPSQAEVLLARRPDLVLDAVVRREDGSTVSDALVVLTHGWRDERRGFYGEFVEEQRSGSDGHARFSLSGGQAQTTYLQLQAELLTQGKASRVVSLSPPHRRGPWPLVLEPGGYLDVEAIDHGGEPLARGAVLAISAEARRSVRGAGGLLLREGRGKVGPLAPGPYRLRVTDRDTGDSREGTAVLPPGETVSVQVRFDDGTTRLAAAGRVLDEQGQPLPGTLVWFEGDRSALPLTVSDDDGAFAFWGRPSPEVAVSVASNVKADRFEPARLQAAFGSRDLVLRRTRVLPPIVLRVSVSEAGDGGPLEGSAFLITDPVRREGGWAHGSLVQGRAEVQGKAHAGLRWLVRCPGYLDRAGTWPRGEEQLELELELQPGFSRRWSVVDAESGASLGSEVQISGQGTVVRHRFEGSQHVVTAVDWPERLRVEAPGYVAERVDPQDLELVTGRIKLAPLE